MLHELLSRKQFNIWEFDKLFFKLTVNDLFVQDANLDTPLHIGIRNEHHYANIKMYYLAMKNPSVLLMKNKKKQTVLDVAVQYRDYSMIKKFICISDLVNQINNDGLNILMKLVSNREDDMACRIIDTYNEIDYSFQGKYGTILHMAIMFCAYKVVDALLQSRIEDIINIENDQGMTALNLALFDNSYEVALKLFSKGGSINYDVPIVKTENGFDFVNDLYNLLYLSKVRNIKLNGTFKYLHI